MKKVIYNQYGNPDVLQIVETEIPVVEKNSVLVKVKTVSINPLDWKLFQGEMKMMSGSKFPKSIGIDFSGIIEEVASDISDFKKGDEVFGLMDIFKGGALAEYIVVGAKDLAKKPQSISFEQAAALPVAGASALQILDKLANVGQGTKVLINGATGGIGIFATQIARQKGAIVTAVTNSRGISLAKKWGADEVINYKTQDVLRTHKKYDVVIDLSGKMSFKTAKVLLKDKASYVNTIPGPKEILNSFIHNLFSGKKYKILLLKPSSDYLNQMAQWAIEGLDILIARSYDMTTIREAYAEVKKGGMLGKAVIRLS